MLTSREQLIAGNIAASFLAGLWKPRLLEGRLRRVLGDADRGGQRRLVADVLRMIGSAEPPSQAALADVVASAPSFAALARKASGCLQPFRVVRASPVFAPNGCRVDASVPRLATPGDIAAWLALPLEHLAWFTDERRLNARTTRLTLQHYQYQFRAKAHGPSRLIEAPKCRLKAMQRQILHGILDKVPTHEAAHGFVAGRSAITGAAVHVGAAVVVCLDLENFFVRTPLGRVHALFRSLGYPDAAARMLVRLCSTVTPRCVFDALPRESRHTRAALRAYREPHLPQGAPTSPALANLVAWRLDLRLKGLARSYDARYTRYADDMTFSGGSALAEKVHSLIDAVRTVAADEGYAVNERKTRVMTASHRQEVTGIVINRHLNFRRDAYDVLKAVLHNCRQNGLEAENREGVPDFRAHLEGRIGWVESLNLERGRRLRAMLAQIP